MNNESKPVFHTVTGDKLHEAKNRYYAGGKELKEGDQICFGFVMNPAGSNGNPSSTLHCGFSLDPEKDQISMSMLTFVLDSASGMLYQLYSKG